MYAKGEKHGSVQQAGREILQLICGRHPRYHEPSRNLVTIIQINMPVLIHYF